MRLVGAGYETGGWPGYETGGWPGYDWRGLGTTGGAWVRDWWGLGMRQVGPGYETGGGWV